MKSAEVKRGIEENLRIREWITRSDPKFPTPMIDEAIETQLEILRLRQLLALSLRGWRDAEFWGVNGEEPVPYRRTCQPYREVLRERRSWKETLRVFDEQGGV